MIRYFIYLFTLFFFVACTPAEPKPSIETPKANQKAFKKEDLYILFALRAEQIHDGESASQLFNTLYEKSNKKEYLYRSLQNDLVMKKNERVVQRVDALEDKEDTYLVRLKIVALMGLRKFNEAETLAVNLVKRTQSINDYLLVSDVYVQLGQFSVAVKYLESAYVKDYNELILDKMSIILYVNLQRKKDAIAQLETHSRVHGCSKIICHRLIGFYSNENNIDGLLSAYLRLYTLNKDAEVAKKIVQVYAYKKEYVKMMDFLENSSSDDRTLLQLYSNTKNYTKAYPLATSLYEETGDSSFLGQSAIYEYESATNKDEKMLTSVVGKLRSVVSVNSDPLYLNYLGYILIDHEIAIIEGMKYIDKAMEIEPNSAYYLDSQAWGYYKLGKCKKAKEVMDRVLELEGSDNEEVILHKKEIDKCLKKQRKK